MSHYPCKYFLRQLRKKYSLISSCYYDNKPLSVIRSSSSGTLASHVSVPNTKEDDLFSKYRNVKDAKPRGSANIFGNLNEDFKLEKIMDSMPEEQGDIIRESFQEGKLFKRRLSTKQYADMIKKNLTDKKVNEALDILEVKMIKEDGVQPENYIYNLLIDGCAKVGYTKKAFKLYNDMKKRGLKVTGATYTSLFNACALSPVTGDGLKRSHHLRQLIFEKQVELNRSNYHAMMKAFGRCGDIVTVFSIVDEMASKNIPLKSDTFSFLLQACITDKSNGFRHAIMVWQKMREKKVKPTIYCYNLMLRSARDCSMGDNQLLQQDLNLISDGNQNTNDTKLIAEGNKEITMVTEEKEETTMVTVGMQEMSMVTEGNQEETKVLAEASEHLTEPMSLPNLLAEKPQMGSVVSIKPITKRKHRLMLLGGSQGLLKQMECDGVNPDVKTATILLDLIPSTNQSEQDLFTQLNEAGVKLDIDFCNMLIKKRCYRHDFFSAKEVVRLISELRLRPNLITFGVLSLSCRNTNDVLQFLKDLEGCGFRPNIEILGGLLCACRHTWNVDMILKIMDIVLREEIKVSKVFYSHLEKFRDFSAQQINLKNNNMKYHEKIDDSDYMKSYNIFLSKFKVWSRLIKMEDRDNIHPWRQFTKPKPVENLQLQSSNFG